MYSDSDQIVSQTFGNVRKYIELELGGVPPNRMRDTPDPTGRGLNETPGGRIL